jgi:hypothetical protein
MPLMTVFVIFTIACSDTKPSPSWAIQAGGVGWDRAYDIAVLEDGSFTLTGSFEEQAVFGPDEPTEIKLDSFGLEDVFVAEYLADGSPVWISHAGSEQYGESGTAITALANGTAVVVGDFRGTVVFGHGEPNETTFEWDGNTHAFIAAYAPDGLLKWARQVVGSLSENGRTVVALADDTILFAGGFVTEAIFNPGRPDEATVTEGTAFLANYEEDGTLNWAKTVGTTEYPAYVQVNSVSTAPNGSYSITGWFTDETVFGLGGSTETALVAVGKRDLFIANYSPDGQLKWATRAGGAGEEQGTDIVTLDDGSVVVTGFFDGEAVFGLGEAGETALTSMGWEDAYIARYDADGALLWANRAGGEGWDRATALTALPDSAIAVTGYFEGEAFFGAEEDQDMHLASNGLTDVFAAGFDNDGHLGWVHQAGGMGWDKAYGIASTTEGSVLVTGYFEGDADFPVERGSTLTSAGDDDIFIMLLVP